MPASPPDGTPGGLANRPSHNLVLGALLLCAIGIVLPWVYTGTVRDNGLSTDEGKVFGALLLLTVLIVLLWRRTLSPPLNVTVMILALALAGVAVYDIVRVSTAHGPFGGSSSAGIGLLLSAAAGVAMCLAVANVLRRGTGRHRPSDDGARP
jgi:hypothetical protein